MVRRLIQFKGKVMPFHQKNDIFFFWGGDYNFSGTKRYISVTKNVTKYWKSWWYPFCTHLKFKVTLVLSIKCLIMIGVINMIFLYCVYSTLLIVYFEENICLTYFYNKEIFVAFYKSIRACDDIWGWNS